MQTYQSGARDPNLQPLINDAYRALQERMHNRADHTRTFICEYDVRKVWDDPDHRFLGRLAFLLEWTSDDVTKVRENYLKILSILLCIGWTAWDTFKPLFLTRANWITDQQLPIEDYRWLSENCFPYSWALTTQFLQNQYVFLPIIIRHNADASAPEVKWSRYHRLPSIESAELPAGASAIVTKELIAAGHIRYQNNSQNSGPTWVAVKTIRGTDDLGQLNWETETQNQQSFRQSLTLNRNIMLSIATVIRGPEFHIVSELADCNLFEFLYGQHGSFATRSSSFTPFALIQEFRFIVGALKHLHTGLQTRAGSIVCAHMDLKPENILVSWIPESPVGLWQITDFGISVVRRVQTTQSQYLSPGSPSPVALGNITQRIAEMTPTAPRRQAGAFQAPEVQNNAQRIVGQKSDMWSLGCIFAMILAFASGGPAEVAKLDEAREDADDDYFYTTTTTRDSEGNVIQSERRVKQKVLDYLKNLGPNTTWMASCRSVVLDLLRIDPIVRKDSAYVETQVIQIEQRMMRSQANLVTCTWAHQPAVEEPAGLIAVGRELPRPSISPGYSDLIPLGPEMSRRSSRSSGPASLPPVTPNSDSMPRLLSLPTNSTATLQSPTLSPSIRVDTVFNKPNLFVKLDTGLRAVDRVRLSMAAHRAAFISKAGVRLFALDFLSEVSKWEQRRVLGLLGRSLRTISMAEIPSNMIATMSLDASIELTAMSMEGTFVAFLIKHLYQQTHQIRLYQIVPSQEHTEASLVPILNEQVAFVGHNVSVSIQGDVLIHTDNALYLCYTDRLSSQGSGLNLGIPAISSRWKKLDFTGVLQAASFSHNGAWIYLWSRHETFNHYYIWRREASRAEVRGKAEFKTSGRHGPNVNFIIPFKTHPFFLTCDNQGIVTMIGGSSKSAKCHQLPNPLFGVVAGSIVPEENAIILLQKVQGRPSHNYVLVLELPDPLSTCKLKAEQVTLNGVLESIEPKSCSFAVSRTSEGVTMFGAHPDGLIERRVVAV